MRSTRQAMMLVCAAIISTLVGCSGGKRPFGQSRVCLGSLNDVGVFKHILRQIARREHMEFFDRTAETAREYKAIGRPNSFVLNVGAIRADGMGVTAGELDEEGYQIGLGYSEGQNLSEAREFAARFNKALSSRWNVETFSSEEPVTPSKTCGRRQSNS